MIAESSGQTKILLTDLYQLTMLQGYFDGGMEETPYSSFLCASCQRNAIF